MTLDFDRFSQKLYFVHTELQTVWELWVYSNGNAFFGMKFSVKIRSVCTFQSLFYLFNFLLKPHSFFIETSFIFFIKTSNANLNNALRSSLENCVKWIVVHGTPSNCAIANHFSIHLLVRKPHLFEFSSLL